MVPFMVPLVHQRNYAVVLSENLCDPPRKGGFLFKPSGHSILCDLYRVRLFQVRKAFLGGGPVFPFDAEFPSFGRHSFMSIRSLLEEPIGNFYCMTALLVVKKSGHQHKLVPFHVTLRKHVLSNDICRVLSDRTIRELDVIRSCVEYWVSVGGVFCLSIEASLESHDLSGLHLVPKQELHLIPDVLVMRVRINPINILVEGRLTVFRVIV